MDIENHESSESDSLGNRWTSYEWSGSKGRRSAKSGHVRWAAGSDLESETTECLRLFCQVAELGSFSAAGNLHAIPASSVSEEMRALEGRLGVDLFERSNKRLTLTADGEKFAEGVRQFMRFQAKGTKRSSDGSDHSDADI